MSIKKNWIVLLAITSLIAAIAFAFSDNLSELAPVLGGITLLSVIGIIYQKNRRTRESDLDVKPINQNLSNFSTGFAILGGLSLGLGLFGVFSPSLSELALAIIPGFLFLIVALLLRIFNGVIAKRIDTTSGILSMSTIILLVGIILLMGVATYVIYSIMAGLYLLE